MTSTEVDTYHEDLPSTPLRQMTEAHGANLLRQAFYQGQMNSLRAAERNQALLARPSGDPIPLEDYEHYFHKAQVIELLLEGGTPLARRYCEDRQFAPEDTNRLVEDAKAFIIAASQDYASTAKEMAIGRYNLLYQRLYEQRDYKGCALIQRCLDRLEGVDDPNQAQTDFSKGLLSIMQQVAREEPNPLKPGQPLLGPATNGVKTVLERELDSNITVEHPVDQ